MPDHKEIWGIFFCSECLTFQINFTVAKHMKCYGKTVEKTHNFLYGEHLCASKIIGIPAFVLTIKYSKQRLSKSWFFITEIILTASLAGYDMETGDCLCFTLFFFFLVCIKIPHEEQIFCLGTNYFFFGDWVLMSSTSVSFQLGKCKEYKIQMDSTWCWNQPGPITHVTLIRGNL